MIIIRIIREIHDPVVGRYAVPLQRGAQARRSAFRRGVEISMCLDSTLTLPSMTGLEPLPRDQLRLAAAEAELYRNTDPAEIYVEESYRLVDL